MVRQLVQNRPLRSIVLLSCLVLSAATQCLLKAGQWESCGAIEGGNISALAIDPQNPQIIYAASYDGLFKSDDEGGNWIKIHRWADPVGVLALAINYNNTEILYAATYKGLLKSLDGGMNWEAMNNGLTVPYIRAFAMDPQNAEILYAGTTYAGIYKSLDGGRNWSEINNGLTAKNIKALAINPQDSQILYAGTYDGGIFKSIDGGQNWNAVNSGLSVTHVIKLAINPINPEIIYAGTDSGSYLDFPIGIFMSDDGGEGWSNITNGIEVFTLGDLVIDPATPSVLYAAPWPIYKSSDGGQSWNTNTMPYLMTIKLLAINPKNSQIIYAATSSGVYRSIDGGINWSAMNRGLTAAKIHTFAINSQDETILYAGTSTGIFKSTDACKTWNEINIGIYSESSFNTLAIDPISPQILYAGIEGYSLATFKSTDSGESWNSLSLLSPLLALAIDPQDTSILYAGAGRLYSTGNINAVSKSTDGGQSWQWTGGDLQYKQTGISSFAINPQNPQMIYAGTLSAGLYRSTDSGYRFTYVSNPGEIRALAMDPLTPDTVYAASWGQGIFKTTNGQFFNAANSGIAELNATSLAIHPQRPSILYTGTYGGGVFTTANGGTSWKPLNDGLSDLNVDALALSPSAPTRLYASTSDGHAWFYTLPSPVQIAVATNPSGRSFWVDGVEYSTSQTFSWDQGSSHTISVDSPQESNGTRYVFANWSDGGAASHTITVPAQATTYTASFAVQYRLTTAVSPQIGGSISANPASADGYYASGTSVQLQANPNTGYSFLGWSGDLTGTTNPGTIVMSKARSVTATFQQAGGTRPSRIPPERVGRVATKRSRSYLGDYILQILRGAVYR